MYHRKSQSDEPFARADRFTAARPARVIGPTVAPCGQVRSQASSLADLLIGHDIVDRNVLHHRVELGRFAGPIGINPTNLPEPEGLFRGPFTPRHRDDPNAREEKDFAFWLFPPPLPLDFERVCCAKWPQERLIAPPRRSIRPDLVRFRSANSRTPMTFQGRFRRCYRASRDGASGYKLATPARRTLELKIS